MTVFERPGRFRLPVVPQGPTFTDRVRGALRLLKRIVMNAWFIAVVAGLIAIKIAAVLLHIG